MRIKTFLYDWMYKTCPRCKKRALIVWDFSYASWVNPDLWCDRCFELKQQAEKEIRVKEDARKNKLYYKSQKQNLDRMIKELKQRKIK